MKWKTLASVLAIAAFTGCGSDRETELTEQQITVITRAAGMLARNMAYSPDAEEWSSMPEADTMNLLEELSQEHTDLWPRFFRAAADSSIKLIQLEEQARQEALQLEML
ncbi:hypothetical protein CSA37_11545 [Candidatus Fermentibacteria bacterium]|nr:MAG: hypothetical protein CSA37_11545 [Candidatus Fermentibacteria bacterium]